MPYKAHHVISLENVKFIVYVSKVRASGVLLCLNNFEQKAKLGFKQKGWGGKEEVWLDFLSQFLIITLKNPFDVTFCY